MIDINFLGGAAEVGKTAILVQSEKKKFLLDYGLDILTMGIPIEPKLPLDAITLSHAHLDHSGCVPYLYKRGYKGGIWTTPPVFELSGLLLRDSIKVQKKKGLTPHFLENDIEKMEQAKRVLAYNQKVSFNGASLEFHNAGHIPGSVSTLLELNNKRILFTGDINFIETKLTDAGKMDYKDIDVLISESTYSYKDHPDRQILNQGLREHVKTVIGAGGSVLIPCFAVGRTQEILMILHDLGVPIWLDGMGIKAAKIMLRHPSYLRDFKELKTAFDSARKIKRSVQRKEVLRKPCVIITTAGMMQAGPVLYYMRKLYNDERNSLVLVGYQADGTPGRTLLDTGRFVAEGVDVKPKMSTHYLDFSDHTGKQHLLRFFNTVKPKKIVLIHGPQTDIFAKELKEKGFNAIAPKNGEHIRV